jgi:hypothetical protein
MGTITGQEAIQAYMHSYEIGRAQRTRKLEDDRLRETLLGTSNQVFLNTSNRSRGASRSPQSAQVGTGNRQQQPTAVLAELPPTRELPAQALLKKKGRIRICSWNVQTLLRPEQLDTCLLDLDAMGASICCLSECRRPGSTEIEANNWKLYF